MYAYLKGKLIEKEEDNVVVETGGVGYNVKMLPELSAHLPALGSEIKIHTYTSVREDAIWLYGFETKEELRMFKQLITVTGIGPKVAQAIIAAVPADELRLAIYTGDVKRISKAPGVGMKTAQRIVLDLKDRISAEDTLGVGRAQRTADTDGLAAGRREAIEALVSLGYSQSDALRVIGMIPEADGMDVEQLLKAALKQMAFL